MKFIVEIPRLPEQSTGAVHETLMTVAARFSSDPARDHGVLVSVHTVHDEELVTP